MEWNVFYHSINGKKISTMNIFNHAGFSNDVQQCLRESKNKNSFGVELNSILMYYFWCKSEYEVVISPWCGGTADMGIKVDIYRQVMNNWPVFLDYCWSYKTA